MTSKAPPGGILVFNAGSSSIKFALFDAALAAHGSPASPSEIGGQGGLAIGGAKTPARFADHAAALTAILARARRTRRPPRRRWRPRRTASCMAAAALAAPCRLTPDVDRRDRGLRAARAAAQSAQSDRSSGPWRTSRPACRNTRPSTRPSTPPTRRSRLRYAIPEAEDRQGHPPLRLPRHFLCGSRPATARDQRRAAAGAPAGAASGQWRQPVRHSRRPFGGHHHGLFAARRADHGHALGRHRRQCRAAACRRPRHREAPRASSTTKAACSGSAAIPTCAR